MDLKNAMAVCLISLCSATIVVLIARALDSQAASQLEPQLKAITEELRLIREQGGIGAAPRDRLVVYYLHSSYRCPTCQTVEAETKKVVESEFGPQGQRGEIAFKVLDYEKPEGAELAREFKVTSAVVVLAAMKDGKIDRSRSKRLDKVLPLAARDVGALAAYLRDEIKAVLAGEAKASDAAKGDSPTIPAGKSDSTPSHSEPLSIPIPE
jgi:hypothetical protein